MAFVEGTGLYDRVIGYDALDDLTVAGVAVLVDFAGNTAVLDDVAVRLQERLVHVLKVGVTHHEEGGESIARTGPKPVWFFAPDAAAALIGSIGQDGFQTAVGMRWRDFVTEAEGWVTVEEHEGADALQRVWRDQLSGRTKPDTGHIVRW